MKKGDVFEGTVLRMDFPNKGILEIEQQRIEVKNALPGQKIRGVVTKKRNGKCEGKLMEVLEHSKEERPEEACVHSGLCGGCLYQGLPYEEQLKIKREQVKRLLDQVTDPDTYEFQGIEGSPISAGYRNKMEFSFGDETKGGPLALGMHKRGSFYDIVTTPECQIVHRDFCRILEATREFFENAGVPFYRKLQHMGYLRHLLVRRAVKTGEILVVLVTTSQKEKQGKGRLWRLGKSVSCSSLWRGRWRGFFIPAMIPWQMWFGATGRKFCMAAIGFMRNFWGCALKLRPSPFSRPTPWERRSFMRRLGVILAIRRIRWFLTFTAEQELSLRFWPL